MYLAISINGKLKWFTFACCLTLGTSYTVDGQDLLGDDIPFSGATIHLRRYVDPGPDRRIISMATQPSNSGNPNLFVTTQDGAVYSVADDGSGRGIATEWFNYNVAVDDAVANASNGFVLDNPSGTHGGLRAVAFHPEFAANGKFYSSAMVDQPAGVPGLTYLGTSTGGLNGESVVAEWTFDHTSGQVDHSSYRELFRVRMPITVHPIKQIAFNNFANPGDEDYGLLYVAHGDGDTQSGAGGGGQITSNALGKILRIDPLQKGSIPYTTPGNPFLDTPDMLDEIYTLGHRNPHHISFAEDANGDTHIIVAEVGRDNLEEINLLQPGGDYGWPDREGTFEHNNNGGPHGTGYGLDYGVSNLPADEWQRNDYVYPAAQYDHDAELAAGWNSLDSQDIDDGQWSAAPAQAIRVTESRENGTTTFDDATPYSLGELFVVGAIEDLALEFVLAGEGSPRQGAVDFILAGDYNDDDIVDAGDYTVWRDNFGSSVPLPNDLTPSMVTGEDYVVWQLRLGAFLTADPGAIVSGDLELLVPEPATCRIMLSSLLLGLAAGSRRWGIKERNETRYLTGC